MKSNSLKYILIFSFLIARSQLQAQDLFVIPRMSEEPNLDGDPFEEAWKTLSLHELHMLHPNSGPTPTEKSQFRIGYTDQYLFFAAYNYDNKPEKIQSTSKSRDEMQLNNDWIGLSLDTYNDKENALDFATTPAGLRLDMQIVNDGEGGLPVNPDWNVIWDVETRIDERGWFAEFRIPLSSLRYQVEEGKVKMGLAVFRYIARKSEWDTYPQMSNEYGFWSWAKVSNFEEVEMHEIKSINPLYFTPYVLGGFQQEYELNDSETAYQRKDLFQRNIGIDVKYGLAKNLTLDLTLNTDFAQVEADDQEVNLTRYSLFFPEKRQFFMERSNVFDFEFGGEGRLFYSRTIGLYDGHQVPLWGGGRLTGRVGDWDIGVMSLQTGPLDENGERLLQSNNHTVIRSRRKLALNKNSYAGFMVTSLLDKEGALNLGYGMDAILNLRANTYLSLKLAQTYDSESENEFDLLEQSRYQLVLENRTFKGLSYVFHYERAGDQYDPAMGFEYREDFRKMGHHSTWGIIAPEDSKLLRYSFGINGDYFLRNVDNSLETMKVWPSFELVTKNSLDFSLSLPFLQDDVNEAFELSDDIIVEPDLYQNMGLDASFSTSSEKTFYTGFSFYTGTYYGGYQNSFSVNPNWSVGNTWKFSATYEFYRINFNEMDQLYQTHLLRFKAWYMYSTKLSAYANIQYNSLAESFFLNAKIRYNYREGNDLYIVFNDGVHTNRFGHIPNLPLSSQRTILLKYTHTFRVR